MVWLSSEVSMVNTVAGSMIAADAMTVFVLILTRFVVGLMTRIKALLSLVSTIHLAPASRSDGNFGFGSRSTHAHLLGTLEVKL